MDYDFKKNYLGQHIAKFSMGHEAFGRWFSEELSNNLSLINSILDYLSKVESGALVSKTVTGTEFELEIEASQISVRALSLDCFFDDELPEDAELFDHELTSDCGLPDFKEALISWSEFIS